MIEEQRRIFLKQSMQSIGIAMCSGSLIALLQACETNEEIVSSNVNAIPFILDLKKAEFSALGSIGGAVYHNESTANEGNDIIIIRLDQTKFLVVSSICTHQGCTVNLPSSDKTTLFCPCHFAEFSPTTGEVLVQPKQGSATTLPIFRNEYDPTSNELTIYLPGNG